MPVRTSPAQDPSSFITIASWAFVVGEAPYDQFGLEIFGHNPEPPRPGFGLRGGYVSIRSCGPRGGFVNLAGAGALDMSADDALDFAAQLATIANGPAGGGFQIRYDPGLRAVDEHARSDGTLSAQLDASGRMVITILPAHYQRGRVAAASLNRADALELAGVLGSLADVAAGHKAHTDAVR